MVGQTLLFFIFSLSPHAPPLKPIRHMNEIKYAACTIAPPSAFERQIRGSTQLESTEHSLTLTHALSLSAPDKLTPPSSTRPEGKQVTGQALVWGWLSHVQKKHNIPNTANEGSGLIHFSVFWHMSWRSAHTNHKPAADSASTSSETRVDLDATDRYGFVMPMPGDQNAGPPPVEPAARERGVETRRLAKWRAMLGDIPHPLPQFHLMQEIQLLGSGACRLAAWQIEGSCWVRPPHPIKLANSPCHWKSVSLGKNTSP